MKRSLILAVAAIACVACLPQSPGERPMVIGVLSDIQSWNPYLTETQFSEDLLALVYPSLVVEMTDYQDRPPTFAPALAERWRRPRTVCPSPSTCALTHSGATARPSRRATWCFTWSVQTDAEVGWYASYTKETITSVEAMDDHTVRFRFCQPDPYHLMDANEGLIVPAHAWEPIPRADWPSTDWLPVTVAGGAFQPTRHAPQQEIVLERNPNYWIEGLPRADRIVWRIVPDQAALLTQLRAGDLDFINRVPPEAVAGAMENPDLQVVTFPDRAYTHICWNTRHPLFRIRRSGGRWPTPSIARRSSTASTAVRAHRRWVRC
jgi:peptide/nickel transport system substrate-binding protein